MENIFCVKKAIEQCDNDEEFMHEMVGLFRDDLQECIELLTSAFKENNFKELKELSHRIKGQAATLAANDLFEKSKSLEQEVFSETKYNDLMKSIKEFLEVSLDMP